MEYSLGELFELRMGKTPDRHNDLYWKEGSNRWISIADLGKCQKYIYDTKEKITDKAVKESGIKIIPQNTVIMSFKLSLGKLAITSEPIYSNEAIMAFLDKHVADISSDYLYYLLMNMRWEDNSNKAVMGKTLNKATISGVKVKIHDKLEQENIVNILDKICCIIQQRKNQLQQLDVLVKSRFTEMFGDPVENRKGWGYDVMKSVCTKITDGEHGSVKRTEKGHPFLNAKHVKASGDIDWNTITYIPDEVHERIYKRCNPEEDDIIMTTTGTIGNVAVVPSDREPFTMDRGITLLKLDKEKVKPFYIAWLLRHDAIQGIMNSNVHASAIGHLFLNKVEQIPVMLPDVEIQEKFSSFVHHVDKLKLHINFSSKINFIMKT